MKILQRCNKNLFFFIFKVYSQGKNHALYLWIYVKPEANAKEVAKAVAKLQKYVDQVTDPKMRDEEDEIWAGVGFGPNFYKQVTVEESVYRCIYSVCNCVYSPYRCL